jgi:hypothetical protein
MANAMITALRARHESIRTGIATLTRSAQDAGRDLTEDELRTVTDQGAEARRIAESLQHLEAEQVRADQVSNVHASIGSGGSVNLGTGSTAYAELGGGESVPALMPAPDQIAEMFRALQGDPTQHRYVVDQAAAAMHARALVTTTQTGQVTNVGTGGTVLREPRRISTSVRLPVEVVQGVEGLAFPVFGAGAADIVAEGVAKPEYAAITAGSAVPQMISVWTDYTRQAALSMTTFEGRLRAKHAALVAKREDLLLVSRMLATTGVQTVTGVASAPYSDAVLSAAGLVLSSDVAAEPDLILVNPADLPKLFPGSTSTGANGETPISGLRLDMHGALVYPTSAVTAGTGIVAALGASARFVVGLRPTVLLDTMSGLKQNKITSLMEEAVNIAIDEPSGIVLVDFIPA